MIEMTSITYDNKDLAHYNGSRRNKTRNRLRLLTKWIHKSKKIHDNNKHMDQSNGTKIVIINAI